MKKMLLLTLALAPSALWAQPQLCPRLNATLNGTYLTRFTGTVNGNPAAFLGLTTFDGQGNLQSIGTGNFNGTISRSPSSSTYTVNGDCTGALTLGGAFHWDMVITPDGSQAYTIQTDAGSIGVMHILVRIGP